ncbi:MAG: TRAP transporter substrate-binding protein [Alphaproteobacteria bacterium]|nr:TRAP transporter substrate-binding protein [Alphaproteobacteria bacterium]
MSLLRRTVLGRAAAAAAAGVAAPALLTWPAGAAEFEYKLGDVLPMEHPLNGRCAEAIKKIKDESGGRLDITLYPNSVLGQDTAMMSQAVSGALQMYVVSVDILAQRAPPAAIFGVGFAFSDYDQCWKAMDGELGDYVRGLSEKVGLHCIDKAFDHGFREITSRVKPIEKPDDLKGFKIRLPVAPGFIALFKHLGASPTAINFGEVYSALQTGLVDGQENPLILIDTAKFYEVQKYCSVTNHIWVGLHVAFNNQAWKKLPPDLQEIAYKNFSQAALDERDDWQKMNRTEMDGLKAKGLIFNTPDTKPFQETLRQTGFYPDMKKELGDQAWGLLEKYVGPLV